MNNHPLKKLMIASAAFCIAPVCMQTAAAATDASGHVHGTDNSEDSGGKPLRTKPKVSKTKKKTPPVDHSKMDHSAQSQDKASTQNAKPAVDHSTMDHTKKPPQDAKPVMDHGKMKMQGGSPPANARDPHENSGGYTLESGPYALFGRRQLRMADEQNHTSVMIDRLERVDTRDGNSTSYDAKLRFGRDYNRLLIKAEGEVAQGKLQEARTELLWSRAFTPYWDTQLGVRYDSGTASDRKWLALGVLGLAPYWFEVDATVYAGDNGRTALRVEAEYDLPITQKLILQPRLETNFYGKRDIELERGSGLSDLALGIRLRYEVRREFAPYIGIERVNHYGETRDLVKAAGRSAGETKFVIGLRFWF